MESWVAFMKKGTSASSSPAPEGFEIVLAARQVRIEQQFVQDGGLRRRQEPQEGQDETVPAHPGPEHPEEHGADLGKGRQAQVHAGSQCLGELVAGADELRQPLFRGVERLGLEGGIAGHLALEEQREAFKKVVVQMTLDDGAQGFQLLARVAAFLGHGPVQAAGGGGHLGLEPLPDEAQEFRLGRSSAQVHGLPLDLHDLLQFGEFPQAPLEGLQEKVGGLRHLEGGEEPHG